MQPYGQILQIGKYTNFFGRFFGEASVILNRKEDTQHKYAELSRMIFLENQDQIFLPPTKLHPRYVSTAASGTRA